MAGTKPDSPSTLPAEEFDGVFPKPLDDRAMRDLVRENRLGQEAEAKRSRVERESFEESLRNVMFDEYFYYPVNFLESDEYLTAIMAEPRIRKLVSQLSDSGAPERNQSMRDIIAMCDTYLNELPLYQPPGTTTGEPTVITPGGAAAFAVLFGAFDEACIALPTLALMHVKNQEAHREYTSMYFGNDYEGYTASAEGLLFAYGERMLFERYLENVALQSHLSPRQQDIIAEYGYYKVELDSSGRGKVPDFDDQDATYAFAKKFIGLGD